MKKRNRILLITVLVVALAGFAWLVSREREPVYAGKRLGQYLDELARAYPSQVDAAQVKAVYAMGPEAIPGLRRALRERKSIRVRGLLLLHRWLPKIMGDRLPKTPSPDYLDHLAAGAAECLAAFGPAARPAAPDLLENFEDTVSIDAAYRAMVRIGPKPEDLPRLLELLKPKPAVRRNAANWAASMYAADLLGKTGVASPQVLEGLTNLALIAPFYPRGTAIVALGALGPKARPALPVLIVVCQNGDKDIRAAAAKALKAIDPQAAAKAGVK